MSQKDLENFVLPFVDQVRVPTEHSKVYKDECCFSFDNPESEDGLFVDLNSFLGFGKKYVQYNFERTGHRLYLKIKHIRKEIVVFLSLFIVN